MKRFTLCIITILFLIYITGCGDNQNEVGSVNEPISTPTLSVTKEPTIKPNKPITTQTPTPTLAITPTPIATKEEIFITVVSAGECHAAAIDDNGILYTWGQNKYGQLGDGTTIDRAEPKPVTNIKNAKSVVCGGRSTYVLCEDGTVCSFGDDNGRDYGDNTLPETIQDLNNIIALDTKGTENIALKSDGTVYAWGMYAHEGSYYLPKQIKDLKDITSAAVGIGYYLAADKNGEVWAWGWNQYLNLHTGNSQPDFYNPEKVDDVYNVKSICGHGNEILALHFNGNVTRWGEREPEVLIGSQDVLSIHSGNAHSMVVKTAGTVCSWGINERGELGDRTTIDHYEPMIIGNLSGVVAADAGTYFSIILKEDGTVWAWGKNNYGQLGNGTTENQLEPQQIFFLGSY